MKIVKVSWKFLSLTASWGHCVGPWELDVHVARSRALLLVNSNILINFSLQRTEKVVGGVAHQTTGRSF